MESLVSKLIEVKGFYCFFATWSLIELPRHDGWSHKVGTTRDILNILAPVVQKLDNAIHRMNRYPADKYYENQYALSFG